MGWLPETLPLGARRKRTTTLTSVYLGLPQSESLCENSVEMAVQRLQKEFKALTKEPLPSVRARPSPTNILEWHYVIEGAEDTDYAGGLARLGTQKFRSPSPDLLRGPTAGSLIPRLPSHPSLTRPDTPDWKPLVATKRETLCEPGVAAPDQIKSLLGRPYTRGASTTAR